MARTRSGNYADIQRSILAKAASLYAAHGYMRSSIADLADACQLSRGALYHYFDSKEAILFAILDAHLREMIARIESAREGSSDEPQERLRGVVRAIVGLNATSPNEQRVLLNDLSFLGANEQAVLNHLGREIVREVGDLLNGIDSGRRASRRTQPVYTMMLFGIINYTYTWFDPNGPVTPEEFADMAVDVFLGGFAAAEPSTRPARIRRAS